MLQISEEKLLKNLKYNRSWNTGKGMRYHCLYKVTIQHAIPFPSSFHLFLSPHACTYLKVVSQQTADDDKRSQKTFFVTKKAINSKKYSLMPKFIIIIKIIEIINESNKLSQKKQQQINSGSFFIRETCTHLSLLCCLTLS